MEMYQYEDTSPSDVTFDEFTNWFLRRLQLMSERRKRRRRRGGYSPGGVIRGAARRWLYERYPHIKVNLRRVAIALRKRYGMSYDDIAYYLSISPSTVWRWIREHYLEVYGILPDDRRRRPHQTRIVSRYTPLKPLYHFHRLNRYLYETPILKFNLDGFLKNWMHGINEPPRNIILVNGIPVEDCSRDIYLNMMEDDLLLQRLDKKVREEEYREEASRVAERIMRRIGSRMHGVNTWRNPAFQRGVCRRIPHSHQIWNSSAKWNHATQDHVNAICHRETPYTSHGHIYHAHSLHTPKPVT